MYGRDDRTHVNIEETTLGIKSLALAKKGKKGKDDREHIFMKR